MAGRTRRKSPTNKPVSKQQTRQPRGRAFTEIGRSGLNIYGGQLQEEFLPELRGPLAYKIYREMSDNDATVGSMLFAVEQLINNAQLSIVAADDSNEAKKAHELVSTSLHDMENSWEDVLSEIMTMLSFGFAPMEVTLKLRKGYSRDPRFTSMHDDGMFGWRSIALMGQDSLYKWDVGDTGEIRGLIQQPAPSYRFIEVPVTKFMLFRTKAIKNNPEGRSVLRSAYRAWYIKRRLENVEAIGLERELTGLPVLQPPEGLDIWNTKDADAVDALNKAEILVRSIRRDEYEGVVIPFGWTLNLQASAGQRTYDTSSIISRWDQRIAVIMLADMLLIGHERVGSFALVASKTKLFSSALEGYTKRIANQFNRKAIPDLMRANGIPAELSPKMEFGPIETPSLKELGEYVSKLTSSNIELDEPVRRYLHQVANFPMNEDPEGGGPTVGGPNEPEEPEEPSEDEPEPTPLT